MNATPRTPEDEVLVGWTYYADMAANLLKDHSAIPMLQESDYRNPCEVLTEIADALQWLRTWNGQHPDGGISQRHEVNGFRRMLTAAARS